MCNCWWCPDNVEWVDQVLYELAYDSEDSNVLCGEFYNLTCSLFRYDQHCDCIRASRHSIEIIILRDLDGTYFTIIDGEVAAPEAKTLPELEAILDRDYPEAELILDFEEE